MPTISLSQIFVSFITFWQNLGVTVEFPELHLPEPVQKAIGFFKNFFNIVFFTIIPNIPKFDLRTQLIILACGIPFILDICIMWFVNPLIHTICHIFDIVALFLIGYDLCSFLFPPVVSLVFLILGGVGVLWILIRFIYFMKKTCCREEISFVDFAKEIQAHYLHGLIPGIENKLGIDKINEQLSKYSGLIQLLPMKPPVWRPLVYLLFSAIFIVAGLIIGGVIIDLPFNIPPTVALFLPYVLYPLGIILFFISILNFSQCGVNLIFKFKGFCKRWGLRLLMLALDLLYIPILTALVSQITPTNHSCDLDYSFYVSHNPNDIFDPFVTHDHVCLPCGTEFARLQSEYDQASQQDKPAILSNITYLQELVTNYTVNASPIPDDEIPLQQEFCSKQCNGYQTLRLSDDLSLRFMNDIIAVNTAPIIFTVIFIMFGIPVFYYILVSSNRHFVTNLNVYGKTAEQKWVNILSRLHTTGIFLFDHYKIQYSFWSVLGLFYKFVIMVLSTLSNSVSYYTVFGLPVVYLLMFIFICKMRPYMFTSNNVLDGILYFLNCVYACFPIAALFGITIPTIAMIGVSAAMLVLPVISVIIVLIRTAATKPIEDDPTIYKPFTAEELEEREERIRKRKAAKRRKRKKALLAKKKAERAERLRQLRLKREEERRKRMEERRQQGLEYYSDDYYSYSDDVPVITKKGKKPPKGKAKPPPKSKKQEKGKKQPPKKQGSKANVSKPAKETRQSAIVTQSAPPPPPPAPAQVVVPAQEQPQQLAQPLQPNQVAMAQQPGFPAYAQPPPLNAVPGVSPMQGAIVTPRTDQKGNAQIQLAEMENLDDDDFLPEDFTKMTIEDVIPLNQVLGHHSEQPELKKEFQVNRLILSQRMEEMYNMLDMIVDGTTIGKLTTFLTTCVLFAAVAFGFFFKGYNSDYATEPIYPCNDYV